MCLKATVFGAEMVFLQKKALKIFSFLVYYQPNLTVIRDRCCLNRVAISLKYNRHAA